MKINTLIASSTEFKTLFDRSKKVRDVGHYIEIFTIKDGENDDMLLSTSGSIAVEYVENDKVANAMMDVTIVEKYGELYSFPDYFIEDADKIIRVVDMLVNI